MKQTKRNILDAAMRCFTRQGFSGTRLQDIAGEAGISVGNMAYHYKNQHEMIEVIYAEIQQRQENLLNEISLTPIFGSIDSFLLKTFQLQQEFLFFFLDTLEIIRASEVIREKYRKHLEWKDMQLELMLQMNEARGALEWTGEAAPVRDLAVLWRRNLNSWPLKRTVEQKPVRDFPAFRRSAWSVLTPYFTEAGHQEYRQLEWSSDKALLKE